MDALPLWISQHALALWAVVLILALLVGDFSWRRARRRRLAATGKDGYLALRPGTAVILLALLAALFLLLAWAVWAQTALVRFDATLAQDLHDQLPQGVQQVVAFVTHAGDPWLIALAAGVVALVLALRRRWRLFVPWCIALAGTAGSGHVVKHFVQRQRPFDGHGLIAETGFSFPSGHAAGSMVFFGLLAYLLLRRLPPQRHRDVIAAAVALVTIIGLSRVIMQAHYLSDVLAGYALGACWLVLGIVLAELLRRYQAR
ncbi:phosphatase PAP2 family protein [Rhodanobacter sp. Si-c]|uniref:undecaprenyl-diphosphate phosphatase n=1 Tax=Rhodanobacter lycopersici TaxID=3162487 RepID=A0ABV3QFE9_9GAMM